MKYIAHRLLSFILLVICTPSIGFSLEAWEKQILKELSNSPNKAYIREWGSLADWEKQALQKTKNQPRVSPLLALQIYNQKNTIIVSVDGEEYFKRRRILNAVNIPSKKFTEKYIKKIISKFRKYDAVILYCR